MAPLPTMMERDIVFPSCGKVLAGTLTLPDCDRRGPAAVFLGGGERSDRTQWAHSARLLHEHGIASLRFDSPGTGASEGDREQSLSERIADARAAVAFLAQQATVDPRAIGLIGGSQGATIATMAAADDADIGFIVPSSGPMGSFASQMLYLMRNEAAKSTLDGEGRAQVVLLWEVLFEWSFRRLPGPLQSEMRTNHGAGLPGIELEDLRRRVAPYGSGHEWLRIVEALEHAADPSAEDAMLAVFSGWRQAGETWLAVATGEAWGLGFDRMFPGWVRNPLVLPPHPHEYYLERVRCPVYAIFGAHDPVCDARADCAIASQALVRGGNADFAIQMLPAGHCPPWDAVLPGVARWICARFKAASQL